MNPSGAGMANGARASSGTRRRAWMLVLVTTIVFAVAAFLAISLMPPVYRAAIALKGPSDLLARWTDRSASEIARAAGLPEQPVEGAVRLPPPIQRLLDRVLSGWTTGEGQPDLGLDRRPGGRLVVWADAPNPKTASTRAEAIAAHLSALETPASAVAPVIPSTEAASTKVALASLRQQLAEASDRAAKAAARRDDFMRQQEVAALPDDTSIDASLQAAMARGADLLRQNAALDRTREAIRAGNVSDGEVEGKPVEGWADLQRLARQKRELEANVAALSQTLLEGHPRMVMARLRLEDIDGELAAASRRVMDELDRRGADLRDATRRVEGEVDAFEARRSILANAGAEEARLTRAAEIEDGVREKLRTALGSAETTQPDAAAVMEGPQPTAASITVDPIERTVLPIETRRVSPWPATAAAAFLGFMVSAAGIAVAGALRSGAPGRSAQRDAAGSRSERSAPEAREVAGLEVAAADDVIDAIIASGISRAILASPGGREHRPLSVDIVRRLATRGHASVLVDLSQDQASSRAMGAAPDAPGIAELIEGDATFAAIARRDFATKADIVPAGRTMPSSRLDIQAERRNVLDFIERSYETLLVDCRAMTPEAVGRLMDADAALLLTVPGYSSAEIETAVAAFRRAGLGDMILVGESRSLP